MEVTQMHYFCILLIRHLYTSTPAFISFLEENLTTMTIIQKEPGKVRLEKSQKPNLSAGWCSSCTEQGAKAHKGEPG